MISWTANVGEIKHSYQRFFFPWEKIHQFQIFYAFEIVFTLKVGIYRTCVPSCSIRIICYYFDSELCWNQNNNITNSLSWKVLIQIFFIVWVSKECIGNVVFCIRHYISRIRIHSISMELLETSERTYESRKTKHVYNLRWRSIISKLEKSLNNKNSRRQLKPSCRRKEAKPYSLRYMGGL